MIKAHKGAPPIGWENVPGMTGFIRQKTANKSADQGLAEVTRAMAIRKRLRHCNGKGRKDLGWYCLG